MTDALISRRWTPEEDERLRALIEDRRHVVSIQWDYVVSEYNRDWHAERSTGSLRARWYKLERDREERENRERNEAARIKANTPRVIPDILWMVMRAQPVESIRGISLFGSWHATTDQEPYWFIPLFESREVAEEWSQDGKYQIVLVSPGKDTVRG